MILIWAMMGLGVGGMVFSTQRPGKHQRADTIVISLFPALSLCKRMMMMTMMTTINVLPSLGYFQTVLKSCWLLIPTTPKVATGI